MFMFKIFSWFFFFCRNKVRVNVPCLISMQTLYLNVLFSNIASLFFSHFEGFSYIRKFVNVTSWHLDFLGLPCYFMLQKLLIHLTSLRNSHWYLKTFCDLCNGSLKIHNLNVVLRTFLRQCVIVWTNWSGRNVFFFLDC